jgi:hypothetical protein
MPQDYSIPDLSGERAPSRLAIVRLVEDPDNLQGFVNNVLEEKDMPLSHIPAHLYVAVIGPGPLRKSRLLRDVATEDWPEILTQTVNFASSYLGESLAVTNVETPRSYQEGTIRFIARCADIATTRHYAIAGQRQDLLAKLQIPNAPTHANRRAEDTPTHPVLLGLRRPDNLHDEHRVLLGTPLMPCHTPNLTLGKTTLALVQDHYRR